MKRSVLAALLGALFACIDSSGPGALLKINLTTPNSGADGAILLAVGGPAPLMSVTPGEGLRLFAEPLAATNYFALTGPLSAGTILIIGVAVVSRKNPPGPLTLMVLPPGSAAVPRSTVPPVTWTATWL